MSHVAGMVRAELLTVDRYETGKQAALTRAPSDTVAPCIIVRERAARLKAPLRRFAALTRATRSHDQHSWERRWTMRLS